MSDGLVLLATSSKKRFRGLHVVIVALNGEREATLDCILRGGTRNFQRTARKHSFLRVVESNRPKFFPIADQLILYDDLVNGKLALEHSSEYFAWGCRRARPLTSLSDSIGT
jgi:hypothetical protein